MICDNCDKNRSIETCGRCRQITKYELVQMVLGLYVEPEAILLTTQRNKTGSRSCKRPPIDSLRSSVLWYHKNTNLSYRQIAKKVGVSPSTVSNFINGKR